MVHTRRPGIPVESIPNIPDDVIEVTISFTHFGWQVYGFNHDEYYFKGYHTFGLANFVHGRITNVPRAKMYLNLSITTERVKSSKIVDFENTRIAVTHMIEDKWGAGHLAEQYMDCALGSAVHIMQLVQCSPAVLNLLNSTVNKSYFEDDFATKYSIMQVSKISSDANEIEYLLNNLTPEVINAF